MLTKMMIIILMIKSFSFTIFLALFLLFHKRTTELSQLPRNDLDGK